MREALSQFVLGFCVAFAPAPLVGFGAWVLTRPVAAEPAAQRAPAPQPGFAAPDHWPELPARMGPSVEALPVETEGECEGGTGGGGTAEGRGIGGVSGQGGDSRSRRGQGGSGDKLAPVQEDDPPRKQRPPDRPEV